MSVCHVCVLLLDGDRSKVSTSTSTSSSSIDGHVSDSVTVQSLHSSNCQTGFHELLLPLYLFHISLKNV